MPFARPQAAGPDENAPAAREGKLVGNAGAKGGQGGTQRRALGDIGNLVPGFNARCTVGKENQGVAGGKKAAVPQQAKLSRALADVEQAKGLGVLTRRAAAAAGAAAGGDPSAVLQVRSNLSAKDGLPAAAVAGAKGGRSMSSLLDTRSQGARAEARPSIHDIDMADKDDPLAATEYVNDIMQYYRRVEPYFRVSPDYMRHQTDINDKMRAILVDWLVEVHLKFKLMPETLYLTINLIDRFLENKEVTRKNLQLVGVTAMLIAAKYEEIWAPEVRDFVYISDKAYTREEILGMEKIMLNNLRFYMTVPTPYIFLQRFLKAAQRGEDKELSHLATFLVELCLPEYTMLKYNYSMIAAAAVYVDLKRKAGNASLVAVYKKFCNTKYSEVAKIPCVANLVLESAQ